MWIPSRDLELPDVYLTFDTDWAADFVLDDLRSFLEGSGVNVTIFATHDSEGMRRLLALDNVETALHPNFLVDDSNEKVLDTWLEMFPGALGIRNHVLYYHSRLLPLFHDRKLEYFSNTLQFLHPQLNAYRDWSGMLRMPIYWEDDIHCVFFDGQHRVADVGLDGTPGLKVLNFHPIHIYLNTDRFEHYQKHKAVLRDEARAKAARRAGTGVRTLFEAALAQAPSTSQPLLTLARSCPARPSPR